MKPGPEWSDKPVLYGFSMAPGPEWSERPVHSQRVQCPNDTTCLLQIKPSMASGKWSLSASLWASKPEQDDAFMNVTEWPQDY